MVNAFIIANDECGFICIFEQFARQHAVPLGSYGNILVIVAMTDLA